MYIFETLLTNVPAFSVIAYIFMGALGACVGSYMEVVRSRGSWRRALVGRSFCGSCKAYLEWYDLIPIFSYLIYRRKCRRCKATISSTHFFAEVVMALGFITAYAVSDSIISFFTILLVVLFMVPIVINDLLTKEIPEHLSLAFVYSAIFLTIIFSFFSYAPLHLALFNGLFFALPFFLLWLVTKGRGIGLADSKIALPLGFFLDDVLDIFSAFMFTFWIGLVAVGVLWFISLFLKDKTLHLKTELPLAPSIFLSFFLVVLFDANALTIFTMF